MGNGTAVADTPIVAIAQNGAAAGSGFGLLPTTLAIEASQFDLDTPINQCGRLGAIVAGSAVLSESTRVIDSGGIPYSVTEQQVRAIQDVVEHAFVQDVSANVWPGSVVSGASLLRGDAAAIPVHRAMGTLSIITDLVGGLPVSQSEQVDEPSAGSVGDARRALLRAAAPRDSAGDIKTYFERAFTLRQGALKVGVDIRGFGAEIDADGSTSSKYEASTVMVVVRQTFYTATWSVSGPGARGVFASTVRPEDLTPYIGAGNPPLIVDKVHYGRVLVITATASEQYDKIAGALRASWSAALSGGVSVSGESEQILRRAQVTVYSLGAPAGSLPSTLTDPVADLDAVYRNGLQLSVDNPGRPVGFTARHIADGSLAHSGLAASFLQPVRAVAGDVQHTLQTWDGRGGGARDTGVDVAPGDAVVIRASGQTWSGVWFTGLHGPEGWEGWAASTGSPAMNINAHALIGRFGLGPWFKVGSFWSGTNTTSTTARLNLALNDNNPYNGNPNERFTITVNVRRRPAAAAGIYV